MDRLLFTYILVCLKKQYIVIISGKKGEKKGMHCWNLNQEPLNYKIGRKKKKSALLGFKPGTSKTVL